MVLQEILSSRNGRSRMYQVLARATKPMPDDRYATVEQLRWALQRAKSQWYQPGLGDAVLTRQICVALIVFILVMAFLLQ
jgi:hypothetical protein